MIDKDSAPVYLNNETVNAQNKGFKMDSHTRLSYWREHCLAKLASEEETPFGPDTLVYKVAGKMFALIRIHSPMTMNLKCDPQEALIIRDSFSAVSPGYHMNKTHWNTIELEADLDNELIKGWIDDSYALIVKGLPKAKRQALTGS